MSHPLAIMKEEKPWYADGLRFQCTECGKCCTGAPGYVWVTEDEIAAIANHLNLSIEKFSRDYLRYVDGKYSLKEHSQTFDCVFLKDKKCRIYQVRPKQCRTYPWWPEHLSSEEAWNEEAKWCEGIRPDAPLVPLETIQAALS